MMLWMERLQVPLYLAAIALGVVVGLGAPQLAPALEVSINPVLGLLLFATFLAIPLTSLAGAFRDVRFLVTVLLLNFVAVPAIVFVLSSFVRDDRALLIGVLLVLLTPCIDYVIVFAGLAGGARDRLLAAAPLLMIVQLVLLPGYLWLFAGVETMALIEIAPFAQALLLLIVLPLAASALTQLLAPRAAFFRGVDRAMAALMVPLMMATLVVVIGSQIDAVGGELTALARLLPIYVAFIIIMVVIGALSGRVARLDVPAQRALTFSGATRNSLVVLPLALALPSTLALVPLAVVTQTLVELVAMVILVKVVPRVIPQRLL